MLNPDMDPVPVLAALGDATRMQLVLRLANAEPLSIAELSSGLDQTRQGVTKHLRVLEQAGIVCSKRVGRESRFSYSPDPVNQVCSYLEDVSSQWDDALSRLKSLVENKG